MKDTPWAQFDSSILARALFARTLCLRGFLDQAVVHAQRTLIDARDRDLKHAQGEVLRLAACPVALLTGDLAAAEQAIAQYREIAASVNVGNRLPPLLADCFEGELLILRQEFANGVATLREAMNQLKPTGWTTTSDTTRLFR